MAKLIDEQKHFQAADIPAQDPGFYNLTVYQFFAPKSVRAEAADVILNDFIAMGIANTLIKGVDGKDRPYTNMVQGDFSARITAAGTNPATPAANNNLHYEDAYNKRTVLTTSNLQIVTPQRTNFPDAAGGLTSRQFMLEHANMGTNRRVIQFAFRAFLCTDIKQWRDGDLALLDDKITRDVNRAPGGDGNRFQTECRTCHQVLDPLRNAFAFHDFLNNAATYTSGIIADKINKNIEYAGGFVASDDSWENRADRNHNSQFGWRGSRSGNGAKVFGQMIAGSFRFSSCTVEQVWSQVCRRPSTADEKPIIDWLAEEFESGGYSLRDLFKKVAVSPACMGIGI